MFLLVTFLCSGGFTHGFRLHRRRYDGPSAAVYFDTLAVRSTSVGPVEAVTRAPLRDCESSS